MSAIQNLIMKLNNGELPDELNFTIKPTEEIDWAKVQYNTFYKSPQFYIEQMPNPKAFMNLPGFNDIVEEMILNAKSPLEEIIERENENKIFDDIIEITDGLDKLSSTPNKE